MNIVFKDKEKKFKDVAVGSIFDDGDDFFIKIDLCGKAVDLKTGTLYSFSDEDVIYMDNAELVIYD